MRLDIGHVDTGGGVICRLIYTFHGNNYEYVVMSTDGWTLDRIEVSANGRPPPLPAPGSVVRVRVTCVSHFNYVYLQLVEEPKKGLSVHCLCVCSRLFSKRFDIFGYGFVV